ncbi:uncharacterized protein LOC112560087 [Pomacea canaliculata]|uniref:uncharacterized protein LOC112560087 n=1 Tax=Pomacea canaliculata TaxID=400727 RepID=UPI000D736B6A|nr:uncharacterized protein LOC112560087 [Pomacea canaliculata]
MKSKVYCLVCLVLSWPACTCVCEFPENLRGRFISNDNNGTLVFNGTHVLGFTIRSSNINVSTTILECLENEGNRYILRSQNLTSDTSSGVAVSIAFHLLVPDTGRHIGVDLLPRSER